MGRATLQGQLHPRRAPLELPFQQQELRSGVVRVIWNCFRSKASPASDMSGAGMAEPLSNGIPGKEPVIYSGPQWYYEWLQSADNSTDGDTRHDLPWICEADNAAAALCLDYIRRRGTWRSSADYCGLPT